MRTRADIESYLGGSGYRHQEVAEGTWLVEDPGTPGARIAVHIEEDLVLFRLEVMPFEGVKDPAALCEKLLRLNATDMVHGAYGIADGSVVMTCVLRLANLDLDELRGTLDDFSLALTKHREQLAALRG